MLPNSLSELSFNHRRLHSTMSSSINSAASNLFCAEDSSSLCEDVESGIWDSVADCSEFNANPRFVSPDHGNLSSGLLRLSPVQREECLDDLLKRETEHLPFGDYLKRLRSGNVDFWARRKTIDWITEVHRYYNFGPVTEYLSLNYLDRFLSAHDIPGKAWMMQLLAVACVSLAAKVEETQVPLSLDLQVGEPRFVFGAKTVERMELLVLTTLHWRMQSVTPFNFVDYFLCRLFGDQMPPVCLFSKATHLIRSATKGIELLEFRPSEIAAAVSIFLSVETHSVEDIYKAISLLGGQVKKEVVAKCVKKIQDLSSMSTFRSVDEINGGGSISSVQEYCLSCRIADENGESSVNSKLDCPKRRKLMHEVLL